MKLAEKVLNKLNERGVGEPVPDDVINNIKSDLKKVGLKPFPKANVVSSLGISDVAIKDNGLSKDNIKKLLKLDGFDGITTIQGSLAVSIDTLRR